MLWLIIAATWAGAVLVLLSLAAAAARGDRQIAAQQPSRRHAWLPPRAGR